MKVTAKAIFRPAGTSYAVYEAEFESGDRHAAGAFSEEEFRADVQRFFRGGEKIVAVRKLESKDAGDGWQETESI